MCSTERTISLYLSWNIDSLSSFCILRMIYEESQIVIERTYRRIVKHRFQGTSADYTLSSVIYKKVQKYIETSSKYAATNLEYSRYPVFLRPGNECKSQLVFLVIQLTSKVMLGVYPWFDRVLRLYENQWANCHSVKQKAKLKAGQGFFTMLQ